MERTIDMQTDTHLSKDFNKVLQSCMVACNNAGTLVEGSPHYDLLKAYYAAVHTFFKNTFFLFENLKYLEDSYSQVLLAKMAEARTLQRDIEYNPMKQKQQFFDEFLDICDFIHMMIMNGLQARHMLVRMSESEPRGAKSIEHWAEKASFKKGNLQIKNNEDGEYV